jgi:repressor LexA
MLTPKQRKLYDYIADYINEFQMAPTVNEIKIYFGLASNYSIQKRITTLIKKGYLSTESSNTSRNLRLTGIIGESEYISILGLVTAGNPIEAVEIPEPLEVPRYLLRGTDNFALRVKGQSMIDANIEDGDIIIIKPKAKAEHGQIIVATINGDATVKKLDLSHDAIKLQPCNSSGEYAPIVIQKDDQFIVKGLVVGLLRSYES